MRIEEDIERLEKAILQEAREEAEQVKAEARAKAAEIRQRAQAQAESERKAILARAREDVNRLRGQTIAAAQLKARTLQLEFREKVLDKVFEAARQKLPNVRQRSDFSKIANRLLREALMQLRVDAAEVHADEATQKVLALDEISKELNVRLTLGSPLTEGIGVVLDAAGGKLHYDNTLGTRLDRLQGALRSSVYHVLIGERL
ncbi:MAG TPA: V-type ATP synthase subunit E [Anaerolineales bacterium]|nr:V-type ATP synthase subunit E [Anaerolineales bacterium]